MYIYLYTLILCRNKVILFHKLICFHVKISKYSFINMYWMMQSMFPMTQWLYNHRNTIQVVTEITEAEIWCGNMSK